MSAADAGMRSTRTVRVERTIEASPEFLFRCFTEPALLEQWWAARNDADVQAEIDARVGGRWRVSYRTRDGATRLTTGEFQEIDAPEHLAFSWKWGEFTDDVEETLVRIRFSRAQEGTTLVLTHGPFTTKGAREAHLDGWRASTSYLHRWVSHAAFLGG